MKKQNLLLPVLAVMLFMFASSCGVESSSSDKPIVGNWKIVKAEGTSASLNQGIVYTFNDDGSATVGSGAMTSKYTFTTEGDTLTMNYNGGTDIILTWTYKIDGNKMTMKNIGSDQKFELEK